MVARGIKAKIAINISMYLLLGMISINLVTTMTAQRDLVQSEVYKGKAVSRLLGDYLSALPILGELLTHSNVKARIAAILEEAGVVCFILLTRDHQQLSFNTSHCAYEKDIIDLTQTAISNGKEHIDFIGNTFGLVWLQPEYLIVAAPLTPNGEVIAGYSLVFPLETIYRSLRHSQQIIFLFILFNTGVLSFLGVYRVLKSYLQPLGRLAKRAEDYKENELELFPVRREDNELQRLSSALNSLIRRLSAEKEKLKATVTSLEMANRELNKAQIEIIRAEKLASVGRLAAGIAHEIGNPIGIVIGYLGLLKQADSGAGERIEYLDRAEKEIERINTIIRQLLEISRPSQGGSQRVSVHALIQNMAQVFEIQPFMSHVRLATVLEAPCDEVKADPNQLRQVFLNLIMNAADAITAKGMGTMGDIVISTSPAMGTETMSESNKNWLRIRFSDNGAGIAAEHLKNVFDPFFTTKEPGKGTGLGLSVSFTIIESFGGRMLVESVLGQGTCMTVLLPTI
jgi:signal transduction histidine kinase